MGDRLATMDKGWKVGLLCPFPWGAAWSPSNTMSPGPRPTSWQVVSWWIECHASQNIFSVCQIFCLGRNPAGGCCYILASCPLRKMLVMLLHVYPVWGLTSHCLYPAQIVRGLDNAYIGGARLPGGRGKRPPLFPRLDLRPPWICIVLLIMNTCLRLLDRTHPRTAVFCTILQTVRYNIWMSAFKTRAINMHTVSWFFFGILGLKWHPLQSAARDQWRFAFLHRVVN